MQFVEQGLHAGIVDTALRAVVPEQFARRAVRPWCGPAGADGRGEPGIDTDLYRVRQRLEDVFADPGAGGFGDVDPQERIAEFPSTGGEVGDRAADSS
jgi:hypothetical protein